MHLSVPGPKDRQSRIESPDKFSNRGEAVRGRSKDSWCPRSNQATLGRVKATHSAHLHRREQAIPISRQYSSRGTSIRYNVSLSKSLQSTDTEYCTRKRQFSRKIIEWDFRKNVSGSERREILQSLPEREVTSTLFVKDPRLKPDKLRSWRKRYREEVDDRLPLRVDSRSSSLPSKSRCTQ